MRVKTFRGATTAQVLAQVKAELGADAVILSSKTLREGGAKVCEIMAAVEPAPAPCPAAGQDGQAEAAWSSEWSQIKSMLLGLASDRLDLSKLPSRQRQALEYLEDQEVDRGVLLRLYAGLKRDPEASLLSILGEMVGVRPFGRREWPQKWQAVSGPYGVGKTTVLLRLALERRREAPAARICLASAEDGQGKGRLVLKHYAELLGMAFRELRSPEDVAALTAESGPFDLILVDLPGLPQGLELGPYLARLGLAGVPGLAVHLALSPQTSRRQMEAFLARYLTKKTVSLIWTKLDEACTFGSIVTVGEATGLPVSALAYGPGLRASLAPAEAQHLWKLLFKSELPAAASRDQAAA
jgi:flagellar biosynthesis protein FlhF